MEDSASLRVLVTAASRHQGTAEVADRIATALREHGVHGEARPIAEVAEVGSYDGVVLGSAVYVGRWLRDARRFAQSNAATLATMPVWLFSSGPMGGGATDEPADALTLAALTGAREHRVFGGRLEPGRLRRSERLIAAIAHVAAADERDWAAVERFAADIAGALTAPAVAAALVGS